MDVSLPEALPLKSQSRSSIAFPLLATILFLFFVSASVPSPLFVVFQGRWGFSPGMLTVAFSIYSLVLLVTLLVAGSLSDHLGRKPVIVAALGIQVASMAFFLTADGIGGLLAARIVQGLSMGVVNGALSAAVIEAAPPTRKALGSLLTSISPLAGLATGALVTGALLGVTNQAEIWAFGLLSGLFCLGAVLVVLIPETASPVPGLLRSMVPSVHVACAARGGFWRGLPLLLSIWALCGFVIALGPSLLHNVFGVSSGLLNGATVAVLCGAGAVSPLLLRGQPPERMAVLGMAAVTAGGGLLLVSTGTGALTLFFVGSAVAGAGLGASFSGLIQSLVPLTPVHERAELFAAIFLVTYLSLSVPPIAAGFAVPLTGFLGTTQTYLGAVLVVSATATVLQWLPSRSRGAPA
ncbi:MFS transporter [Beijerinckia indica]|uniref:Major facilitator superfamily MFS_1 n=1 Tax=Beijerinckia indica subsp. indica (strain ATCC 9039 / DSM 1715 / NCIMB 8712) TaxID=395963 RepID=B2IJ99_BEII9|nr:MFS transporter [Beijerinckia indica]ACB96217.1 major facilitator superfamily MFS_1 [Beijerinckia indica subsp. indica ATCC 9039]